MAQCPDKFYPNPENQTCLACKDLCLKCTDLETCIQCESGYTVNKGRCICNYQYYYDPVRSVCTD